MPTLVSCPSCHRKLRVPDDLLGRQVECPSCECTFTAAGGEVRGEPPVGEEPAPSRRPSPEEEYEEEAVARRRRSLHPPEEDEDEPERRRGRPDDDEDDSDEDDEDRPRRRSSRPRRDLEPHRGALILVLGILSVCAAVVGVCCFGIILGPAALALGISAWVMGQGDRNKMAAGTIDPAGRGNTTAGWICGIIGTILGVLALLLNIAMLILGFSGAFGKGDPFGGGKF